MRLLDEFFGESDDISKVMTDIEEVVGEAAGGFRAEALIILKNVLTPMSPEAQRQELEFERSFVIPGSLRERWAGDRAIHGLGGATRILIGDFLLWLLGRDSERFRDRCDRYLWRVMVPEISSGFGDLADEVMNTINEAIINYGEYSFRPWALRRRIEIQLFKTDARLAYAIIRPSGTRLRPFDPLELTTRPTTGARDIKKRGWGHTLLMERALFLSFDTASRRRGMMIIVGPRNAPRETPDATVS